MIARTCEVPDTRSRHRAARHALGTAVAITAALGLGTAHGAAAAVPEPPEPVTVSVDEGEQHAAVLASEDRRLTEIRTVTSLARWQGQNYQTPYRLGTAAGYTLVLTPRSEPYTVQDLLTLAPQTFLRMSDGAFLLSEHVVVMSRATLRLASPGGLVLRLASGPHGFSTIVSLGGILEIEGSDANALVEISSWDADRAEVDTITEDGRAYVRAIGGQFDASYARLDHLGFWSGRSGGLSLTGTDRPNTGAIETLDPGEAAAPGSLLDDVTWQPAGELAPGQANPTLDFSVPAVDFVSGRLDNVTVTNSAYGLFVSGATGIQVSNSRFDHNLNDGVLFHRYVSNGVITTSSATGNRGDGFALARATTSVSVSESTAHANAGSGFSLDGRSLADGPSAAGTSMRDYGNNAFTNNHAAGNAAYGIEIRGGFNIGVQNNTVDDHDMGIMVAGPANSITVVGNTVRDADRHGIALVDGVTDVTVTGNVVNDATTGVYLRNSAGLVKGNTIESADSHGVSLVGSVDGTEVSFNVLAGTGASALDQHRSSGSVAASMNNMDGWHDTTPWYVVWSKKMLQPMSLLWSVLAVLIIVSAVRGRGRRRPVQHPYAHQMAHHGVMPMPEPAVTSASGLVPEQV